MFIEKDNTYTIQRDGQNLLEITVPKYSCISNELEQLASQRRDLEEKLQQVSHLKKDQAGKFSLIYKKHSHEEGLISSYGKNINDAVRKRDEIALKSLEYMFDKINSIKF